MDTPSPLDHFRPTIAGRGVQGIEEMGQQFLVQVRIGQHSKALGVQVNSSWSVTVLGVWVNISWSGGTGQHLMDSGSMGEQFMV